MLSPQLRRANRADLPFLEEMLFEAAFWRPSLPRPLPAVGLRRPDLAKVLSGWGRRGDTGLVAISPSAPSLGAAWYRFWSEGDHSYGFVSQEIPELAIGVRGGARGRGVGSLLLRGLLAEARPWDLKGLGAGNAWTMVAHTSHGNV